MKELNVNTKCSETSEIEFLSMASQVWSQLNSRMNKKDKLHKIRESILIKSESGEGGVITFEFKDNSIIVL